MSMPLFFMKDDPVILFRDFSESVSCAPFCVCIALFSLIINSNICPAGKIFLLNCGYICASIPLSGMLLILKSTCLSEGIILTAESGFGIGVGFKKDSEDKDNMLPQLPHL